MKKILSFFAAVMLVASLLTVTAFAAGSSVYADTNVKAVPGGTATVNVYISGNTGFDAACFDISCESGLTIASISNGLMTGYINNNVINHGSTYAVEGDGIMFTVVVNVAADAVVGDTYDVYATPRYVTKYNSETKNDDSLGVSACVGTVVIECAEHVAGTPVEEAHTSATCTTDGCVDTVTYCSICGEEMNRVHSTLPATGHSYTAVVTAPTCTEKGYTTYTCACGDSYTSDEVAALGHSYTSEVTTAATCTTDGVMTHTCPACGDTYTEVIPATGHKYDWVDNGDGTHTGTCACGDTITENHTWGEDGKTCNKCGATKPTEPSEGPTKPTEGPGKHETGDITPYPVFFLMAAAVIGTAYGFKRKIVK